MFDTDIFSLANIRSNNVIRATITWIKISILFMDIDRYTKSHSSRWLWSYFHHMDIDDGDYDFITFVLYVLPYSINVSWPTTTCWTYLLSWMPIMSYVYYLWHFKLKRMPQALFQFITKEMVQMWIGGNHNQKPFSHS